MTNSNLRIALPPPLTRPFSSSTSNFQLASPATSSSDDSDAPLPFPTALSRTDFLSPDFHAATYLSSLFPSGSDTTLAHRHQTLEDLRAELRERSTAISAELLELVNGNYTAFLGLGDELKGGGERVEDVRVALLGFRRAVADVRTRVSERRAEVDGLTAELGDVRQGVEQGRRMLEVGERLVLLEGRLEVESLPAGTDGGFGFGEGDDEDEEGVGEEQWVGSSPAKLAGMAREYVLVRRLAETVGWELPYMKKMEERMIRCRNTMLLDLNAAVKEARTAGERGQERMLKLLDIYRVLGAEADAVKVLKER